MSPRNGFRAKMGLLTKRTRRPSRLCEGGGLPEKEGEFEDNVCDVKYCQKLIISISSQIQVV